MKCFFLIIVSCLFISLNSFAQREIIIFGNIATADSLYPVYGSPIEIINSKKRTLSNGKGNYYLNATVIDKKNILIQVNDIRFKSESYLIKWKNIQKLKNDSIRVDFILKYSELEEVEITDAPLIAYKSRNHNVSDFEFYEDKIILLTYEKKLEKGSRVLMCDEKMHVYANIFVPDEAKELYRDFQGKINLVCVNKVFVVNVYDTIMGLVPIEKEYFNEQVKPLVDSNNNRVYFSNFVDIYPAFDYFAYNQYDSSYTKLRHLIDKPLMDLYRAQYKYVEGRDKLEAYRAELRTGIDKEIWVAIWSGFPQSIYYKPLYAPMFIKEDTILIFDHYSNYLFKYDRTNKIIDSIKINYHQGKQGKDWEKLLVKDYTNEKIYGVYQHAGISFLQELNTSNGEIIKINALKYKYPTIIKVHNGYAYYIYRPFESSQNKYLYKEKLDD